MCAKVVGDVMGNYHPHGDSSIYEALGPRMSQSFAMRMPLIDGSGNFGSVDGDNAAAMRYTECRMTRGGFRSARRTLPRARLRLKPNYDGSREEPVVLAESFSQSAGQWRDRHRSRNGDQYSASQP